MDALLIKEVDIKKNLKIQKKFVTLTTSIRDLFQRVLTRNVTVEIKKCALLFLINLFF